MDNLSFIRDTMARSAPLTAISGTGTIIMGVIALVGAYVAGLRMSPDWWVYSWLVVACIGCLTGLASLALKARRQKTPVLVRVGRKFVLSLFPPIVAGVVLTGVFYELNLDHLMPGTWLLLYGTGIVTGGAFSVRIVPAMGLCFMVLGTWAILATIWNVTVLFGFLPVSDGFLVIGFGGFHILFGAIIARQYGG